VCRRHQQTPGALVSDGTRALREAVVAPGTSVVSAPDDSVREVTGTGRGPVGGAEVRCADAGTAARFLPPFAATGQGEYLFDGSGRLRARPLGP
jgi:3-phosphoshikimate 1-carboxyvinyltransferase